jgi:hypothetical protein
MFYRRKQNDDTVRRRLLESIVTERITSFTDLEDEKYPAWNKQKV